MNLKISPTASFDVEVAIKYGHTEALLINHFAHWIRVNQRKSQNQKDGRTWMYQTLEEIAENFPYLTKEQVRTIIDHLCLGKSRRSKGEKHYEPLLMKGNYNKLALDKTTWYAFIDESFLNSNSSYERVNAHSTGQIPPREGQMPTPIPIAIKTEAINPFFQKGANIRDSKTLEAPLSNRKKEIALLSDYAKSIGFDLPDRELGIWLSKHDGLKIKANIELARRRKWKNLIKFLETALKFDYAQEEKNVKINRSFFLKFCEENKLLCHVTEKYASLKSGVDLQFSLNTEQFNKNLLHEYRKI